jgi:hypothetical protein
VSSMALLGFLSYNILNQAKFNTVVYQIDKDGPVG